MVCVCASEQKIINGSHCKKTRLGGFANWSAPLLFAYWKESYINLLQWILNFLASLCSWGDCFWNWLCRKPRRQVFSRRDPIFFHFSKKTFEPAHEILILIFTSKKGSGEPAHMRRLTTAREEPSLLACTKYRDANPLCHSSGTWNTFFRNLGTFSRMPHVLT